MPTPPPLAADGDPPEDTAAAEGGAAQRDQSGEGGTPRTEHPMPESLPSNGAARGGD